MGSFGLQLTIQGGGDMIGYFVLIFVLGVIGGYILRWYFTKRKVM